MHGCFGIVAASASQSRLGSALNRHWTGAYSESAHAQAMCRYASGQNAFTGVDTRKSLGCGSRRKFASSSPSSYEGPQVADEQKKAFQSTMPSYRQ